MLESCSAAGSSDTFIFLVVAILVTPAGLSGHFCRRSLWARTSDSEYVCVVRVESSVHTLSSFEANRLPTAFPAAKTQQNGACDHRTSSGGDGKLGRQGRFRAGTTSGLCVSNETACRYLPDHSLLSSDVQAAEVGNKAEVPLGLSPREIVTKAEISRGTQSVVYEGDYADQRVAIKKAKIGKSADLDSFKLEVAVMAKLRHVSSVVSLVAARLLPPGASLSVSSQCTR